MRPSKKTPKALSPDRFFKVCTPGSEIDAPEFVDLLVAYGQAMWAWTRVEAKWFLIFASAVEPNTNNHSKALRAAFFSIINPRSRLEMIHSVAEAIWKNQGKNGPWSDWVRLHEECSNQLRIRGKMAHLTGHSFIPVGKKKPVALLMQPIWHPKSPKTHGEARSLGFDVDRLSECARDWNLLNERLGVFCALVSHSMQHRVADGLTDRLRVLLHSPNSLLREKLKQLPPESL